MTEWLLWLSLIVFGLFLWWLAYYATKRIYINKSDAREAGAGKDADAGLRHTDEPRNMEEH